MIKLLKRKNDTHSKETVYQFYCKTYRMGEVKKVKIKGNIAQGFTCSFCNRFDFFIRHAGGVREDIRSNTNEHIISLVKGKS